MEMQAKQHFYTPSWGFL